MADDKPAANGWKIGLEQARQARVDTHHSKWSRVAREISAQRRDPPPEIAVDLGLQEQRNATGDQAEQAAKGRDWSVADPQPGQLAVGRSADPQWARAHPPGVGIVEDEQLVIRSQPQVALDPGT